MNDDLESGLRDFYRALTPADSHRAANRVSAAIAAARASSRSFAFHPPIRALALLGAVAAVAMLVAAPLLLRSNPGPAASPSASAPAGPTATPSPVPSPSVVGDWIVLANDSNIDAAWSPDGEWLTVEPSPNDGQGYAQVKVFDRTGKLARTLDGDALVWLDASQFVLERSGGSLLGSMDSADLTPLTPPVAAGLANWHGAIAVQEPLASSDASRLDLSRYHVWTVSGSSPSMPGVPTAWSRDGSRLAVIRYPQMTKPQGVSVRGGWMEVLSWPGLQTVATFGKGEASYYDINVAFDPSGRYLSAVGDGGPVVLDVDSNRVLSTFPDAITAPSFYRGGLLVSKGDGTTLGYSLAGTTTGEQYSGDSVFTSSDGSAAVIYATKALPSTGPITLLRDGRLRTIEVPAAMTLVMLAPDGSGVAVICDLWDTREVLLLAD
jgi:hypothetical protein